MVFLPGNHALDTNITVANVARLTMHGESSSGNIATVVCDGLVGLSFSCMVDFKIYSLSFTSCSRKYAITLPGLPVAIANVTLLLHSTHNAELVNCSFHDNIGSALVVNNTNITLTGNTEFTHNYLLCGSIRGGAYIIAGVGITAFASNLTFTGNTTFLNNNAGLIGQLGCDGGTIYALDNTVLSFSGTNTFINNSGSGNGGAVLTYDNTVVSFDGVNNFIDNLAYSGAAIYASDNTVLNFNGTNNFTNNLADNYGGAIYTSNNTVLRFSGISNFINNSAGYPGLDKSGTGGGAICTYDNTVISFDGINNFINNSAGQGGAFFTFLCITSNVVLSFNGTNNFINNSAVGGGGAIYMFNGKLTFNGTTNFTNNVCIGRVDVNRRTIGGGAVMGLNCTFSILPNTTVYWENNHATVGGAT